MGRIRTDYKTCQFCGAVLDIGEQCDCMSLDNSPRESYTKIMPVILPDHKTKEAKKLCNVMW